MKRDLRVWQKRPTEWQKRPTIMAKETCIYRKRDLLNGKRDLLYKRPIEWQKETCIYSKRDLRVWQKRPTEWQKRPTGKPAVVARAAEPVREHGKICIFFHFFSFFLNNMGRKSEPYYY